MDDGVAGDSESITHARAVGVVPRADLVAEIARTARAKVVHVHFVIDPDAGGAGDTVPLFRKITSKQTVVRGTYGAKPFRGAESRPGDLVRERPRMSAFHGTPLDTILRNLGTRNLVITGVHTNHAVGTTARVAAGLGYTPILVSDATTSMSAKEHAADLRYGFADIAV